MSAQTRLYVILARDAPVAVVFRRGPSKQVLLISWDLQNDTFAIGQWLKGRIYERRSDLTPRGDLLLYFAANHATPDRTWTAISRPPYLTALALWPKGDAWGGGGLFRDQHRIALNHPADQMVLGDGFSVPRWWTVEPFGISSGAGEDTPIAAERLKRDGWRVVSQPQARRRLKDDRLWIRFDPPEVLEKPHPLSPDKLTLRTITRGVLERNGAHYVTEHELVTGEATATLGRTEWAEWDRTGDLLFAKGGSLYRLAFRDNGLAPVVDAVQLADFSNLTFERRVAPPEERTWPPR
jgi:hypothetical protein